MSEPVKVEYELISDDPELNAINICLSAIKDNIKNLGGNTTECYEQFLQERRVAVAKFVLERILSES